MPTDARFPSCVRKQRSTRQVDTGREDCHVEKKDKKDGTFEQVQKCKPIYRTEGIDDDWCSYTVLRWREVTAVRTTGTDLNPAWPAAGLPAVTAASTIGARRQGEKAARDPHDPVRLRSRVRWAMLYVAQVQQQPEGEARSARALR